MICRYWILMRCPGWMWTREMEPTQIGCPGWIMTAAITADDRFPMIILRLYHLLTIVGRWSTILEGALVATVEWETTTTREVGRRRRRQRGIYWAAKMERRWEATLTGSNLLTGSPMLDRRDLTHSTAPRTPTMRILSLAWMCLASRLEGEPDTPQPQFPGDSSIFLEVRKYQSIHLHLMSEPQV